MSSENAVNAVSNEYTGWGELETPLNIEVPVQPTLTADPSLASRVVEQIDPALAADPGWVAAMAGGAAISEPVQWVLVTLAGLFCAAVGHEILQPGSIAVEENQTSRPLVISAEGLTGTTDLRTMLGKEPPKQANRASFEEEASRVPRSAPEISPVEPRRANFSQTSPAKLEDSPIKPTRLQTGANLKKSSTANISTATSVKKSSTSKAAVMKSAAAVPCDGNSKGRLFHCRRHR